MFGTFLPLLFMIGVQKCHLDTWICTRIILMYHMCTKGDIFVVAVNCSENNYQCVFSLHKLQWNCSENNVDTERSNYSSHTQFTLCSKKNYKLNSYLYNFFGKLTCCRSKSVPEEKPECELVLRKIVFSIRTQQYVSLVFDSKTAQLTIFLSFH